MSGDPNGWRAARGRTAAADLAEYRLVIWKGQPVACGRSVYHEPVDVLAAAVDYLKRGYQGRLGDETVEHFTSSPHAINPAWLPSMADWNLINGVLGRALLMRGFFTRPPRCRACSRRAAARADCRLDRAYCEAYVSACHRMCGVVHPSANICTLSTR